MILILTMNIIFITFWGVGDSLSQSSAWASLRSLLQVDNINLVVYVTLERGRTGYVIDRNFKLDEPRIAHIGVGTGECRYHRLIEPFIVMSHLHRSIKELGVAIDKIIGRCSPTIPYAIYSSLVFKVDYLIESFEPHADDMLETKQWSRLGPKYLFQKVAEKLALRSARTLITVSKKYASHLHSINTNLWLETVPCTASDMFFDHHRYSIEDVKEKIGVTRDDILAVYVGKFGGLYEDEKAFEFIKVLCELHENVKVIILTSQVDYAVSMMKKHKIYKRLALCDTVPHVKIPEILHACDFGLSFIRSTRTSQYCSPIKHAEYLAVGIPILMFDYGGDDCTELEELGFSKTVELTCKNDTILKINSIINVLSQFPKDRVRSFTKETRSESVLTRIYEKVL